MTPKIDTRGAGIHVVSEANGFRSREEILVAEDSELEFVETATILGKVTATGKYVPLDLEAGDGSEDVAGVLWGRVDVREDDARAAAHVRDCELLGSELVYPEGATEGDVDDINAALEQLGIIVR